MAEESALYQSIPADSQKLESAQEWPSWFKTLEYHAMNRGIWHLVNPAAPDAANPYIKPIVPTIHELVSKRQEKATKLYIFAHEYWESTAPSLRTARDKPELITITQQDVKEEHERLVNEAAALVIATAETTSSYRHIQNWVDRTVDKSLRELAMQKMIQNGGYTVQAFVRFLQQRLEPSKTSLASQIRQEYRAVMEQAKNTNVSKEQWIKDWETAYRKAEALEITEIQGPLATKDWLRTIAVRMAPQWANQKLSELVEQETMERPTLGITDYARIFSAQIHEAKYAIGSGKQGGVFFTGDRSGAPDRTSQGSKKDCPCGRKHPWEPTNCWILRLVITGSLSNAPAYAKRTKMPGSETREKIKAQFASSKWSKVRQSCQEKWGAAPAAQGQDRSGAPKFPGSINAAVINAHMMEAITEVAGQFSTTGFTRHPLSDSTLVDNCGAMHLVNRKSLLVEGSFRRAEAGDHVQAGTSSFPISGYGKRVISKVLASSKGTDSEDLVLNNVAVVEGFHVNIVSEALITKAGAWYCGFDCTLRHGNMEKNVVLKKLERRYNLVFLQYTPVFAYLSFPMPLAVSAVGTVLVTMMKRGARHSQQWLRPREDTEHLWHARAGHLGPEALKKLVERARNVVITGTKIVDCEHCALAHSQQIVSRRRSEGFSHRPFLRISWDLFYFKRAWDGSIYLLVVKDEYSGKLFCYPLEDKKGPEVFGTIKSFVNWVKRQFGLTVCIIRQDRETSTIAIRGYTPYQLWAIEEGIEIEATPSHTHEPNGGSERAGQELIVKSIKMREGANLPESIWPECVRAAAYLHGMSPSRRNDWMSPNEKLHKWFRQYFRWYTPPGELGRSLADDHRPDWSGVYAYGCRAYVLDKRREAEQDKLGFKTKPRGHIGYLVGYVASNIYRIWCPQLKTVLTTRNVVFDEKLFYKKESEEAEALPVQVTRRLLSFIEIEPQIQDALSVPELLTNVLNLDAAPAPTDNEAPTSESDDEDAPEGQNSGVSAPGDGAALLQIEDELAELEESSASTEPGLLTPESTPEVETQPQTRGSYPRLASERARSPSADRDGLGETEELSEQGSGRRETPEQSDRASTDSVEPRTNPEENGHLQEDSCDKTSITSEHEALEEHEDAPSEDSAEDTITVAEPETRNTRPRINYPPASRQSRRLQGQPAPPGSPGSAIHAFTVQIYNGARIDHPVFDESSAGFFATFLPDQRTAVEEGSRAHRTLHAVFQAAVLQAKARLNAAPSLPRLHRDDLSKLQLPRHWRDLENHTLGPEFKEACRAEIRHLLRKGTWRKIERAAALSRPLPLKWVFTYKFREDNTLEKCKARICVRGDLQEVNTLQNTYTATLAARSFRTMMAFAAQRDLEVWQFDVVQAFLYATRDDDSPVVCELPDGFKEEGFCCELKRALYGLRDSPLLWYKEFTSTLKELGLALSNEEPCLAFNESKTVFVLFYVDDYLVVFAKEHREAAEVIMQELRTRYEVHEKGEISSFIGIQVIRDRGERKLWLVHNQYIEKIAKRYNLSEGVFPSIPLPGVELLKNTGSASKAEVKEYQELVGSILYTAIMIRLDVAFSASILSQFLVNPSPEHLAAAKQTIRYLYGSRYVGIKYGGAGQEVLVIASDASFADNTETRRSSQGYIMMLFGGAINWRAARQHTVTTSSTEAELLALTYAAKETMAFKRLMADIACELGPVWRIFCDNQQTIRLVVGENERVNTRLRHVDIHNMWARQEHAKGSFEVTYLPTQQMPADGLTKLLSRQRFEHFVALVKLEDTGHIGHKSKGTVVREPKD